MWTIITHAIALALGLGIGYPWGHKGGTKSLSDIKVAIGEIQAAVKKP